MCTRVGCRSARAGGGATAPHARTTTTTSTLPTPHTTARRPLQGDKPMDDPALIAKALKRMHKAKVKSAVAWAERKEKEAGDQAARQSHRSEMIAKKKSRGLNEKGLKALAAKDAARAAPVSGAAPASGASHGGAPREGKPSKGGGRAGFEGRKKAFLN